MDGQHGKRFHAVLRRRATFTRVPPYSSPIPLEIDRVLSKQKTDTHTCTCKTTKRLVWSYAWNNPSSPCRGPRSLLLIIGVRIIQPDQIEKTRKDSPLFALFTSNEYFIVLRSSFEWRMLNELRSKLESVAENLFISSRVSRVKIIYSNILGYFVPGSNEWISFLVPASTEQRAQHCFQLASCYHVFVDANQWFSQSSGTLETT